MRIWWLLMAVLLPACGAHRYGSGWLEETPGRLGRQSADERCGPVGLRRVSLGTRWGEALRVYVESATPVRGVARVHVAGRPEPATPFVLEKGGQGRQLLLERAWENERLSVPSGLDRDVVLDVTVTELTTPQGDCGSVVFSLEQGVLAPRDEKAFIAELIRRGGPDVEAWRRAEAEKEALAVRARPPPMPTLSPSERPTTGRVFMQPSSEPGAFVAWTREDTTDETSWTGWPESRRLRLVPVGPPLGRAGWVVLAGQTPSVLAVAEATSKVYGVELPQTPVEVDRLLTRLRFDLESEDAAVLAFYAGLPATRAALKKVRAAKTPVRFDTLARHLTDRAALDAASQTLQFSTAYGLGWPLPPGTRLSSHFGPRTHPTLGGTRLHTGIDLPVPEGTLIRASDEGLVLRAGEDSVSGRFIVIDHGFGVTTAYCHNSRLLVTEGQYVGRGDVISESGNTGRSTGPHLHYQLELGRRPVDPLLFRGAERPMPVSARESPAMQRVD